MKLIILAAGYATRLYPLTLNQPKPLLPVAGKPMVEHVLKSLDGIRALDRICVVTNAKFAGHFERWAAGYRTAHGGLEFTVVNDGSTDDSNKLGAIGDLHLVITRERLDDDLIVVAGDNLFSEPLAGFESFCARKQAPVVGIYDVKDLEQAKKYNTMTLASDGRISFFEEKCMAPANTLCAIALYYYPRHTLPLIRQYVAEGNNPDQPGRLIQWLYPRVPVYTWTVPGIWYDIGSKETLEEANRIFARLRSMASTRHCWKCGTEYTLPGSPGRSEACSSCGSDLKTCLNCVSYDPRVAQQCRDRRADPVAEKHLANYCEYFEMIRREFTPPGEDTSREAKARETLKKLLGE